MFLNVNRFVTQMKKAYRSKLVIGNIDNGLVIHSGHWAVWIDAEHVPNKIKGTIMELAGELPEEDTIFEICKNNPVVTMLEDSEAIRSILNDVENADMKVIATPVLLKKSKEIRLFQPTNCRENLCGIDEDLFLMIDNYAINLDVEGEPTGPCYTGANLSPIYWHNYIGTVVIFPIALEHSVLVEALIAVNFEEEAK